VETVKTTRYRPVAENTWLTIAPDPLVPSPKFQSRAVILPVDVSVKVTFKGAWPLVGLALKLATSGGAVTVIEPVAVVLPPGPVTVNCTV